MKVKKYALILGSTLAISAAHAQDLQFSQFYAAPTYLNPAFAGSTGHARATVNYRNQWPALDANFVSYMATYDQYIGDLRSSFGVIVKSDNIGGHWTEISSNDVALQFSHLVQLNDQYLLQLGVQGGIVSKGFGVNNHVYPNQIDDNGYIPGASNGENFPSDRFSYADFGTGALLFSEHLWVSLAAHHLNRPKNGYYTNIGNIEDLRLPVRYSFNAGYRIPFVDHGPKGPDHSITPVVHYQMQGKFDQAALGMYINYEPIMFGMWYRGLPFKVFEDQFRSHDAYSFMFGLKLPDFSLGYSYDIPVNPLGFNTAGAHEISLVYEFTIHTNHRTICPHPWKRFQTHKIRRHR